MIIAIYILENEILQSHSTASNTWIYLHGTLAIYDHPYEWKFSKLRSIFLNVTELNLEWKNVGYEVFYIDMNVEVWISNYTFDH